MTVNLETAKCYLDALDLNYITKKCVLTTIFETTKELYQKEFNEPLKVLQRTVTHDRLQENHR